jgi:apolipoprotein N-acyltransferase
MAFIGAVLLWAAFPPWDLWLLAWVAPIPWVLLIRREKLGGRRPYTMLTAAGFAFWMGALHFLRLPHWATSFGWVALSLYFALYLPLFVGLSRVAVHRLGVPVVLAAPVVWTGLELARAHLLTGMSMASLGHTQYRWIGLIQMSDLAGAYGVSFVVMLVAASLARMVPVSGGADALRTRYSILRSSVWLLPAVVVLAAVLLYGHWRIAGNATEAGPKIALIQGKIDTEMRYDPGMRDHVFTQYYDLSREALEREPHLDLIVWPETMFLTGPQFMNAWVQSDADARRPRQFVECSDAEFRRWLPDAVEGSRAAIGQVARLLDVPLLLGVDVHHYGADGVQSFNSAVHVARDGRVVGRYDKMHLVMFGEYVPFADRFPWLQGLTPLPVSATAGSRPAAFRLDGVRLAPNICYESVLSHVIRGQVHRLAAEGKEPDILVNLTNDGWFWGSSELDLHLVCGVFRAVECRKPFLIAANTGFSAWIDSDGRIQKQGRRRATDVIVAEPGLDRARRSWYLANGDWFAGTCLAACGLFALAGLVRRKSVPHTPLPYC